MGLPQRQKMEILFAVMLGLFLGALDQTIVGPALPTIVTQLQGNEYYTWAVTIFLLTSTISVPFWGKLSDLYGRKPIFMIGISIFLVGSALSGLSQEMWQLILFRGIQGIGAGSIFPVALAVIGDMFTPQERGKYQGLFGAVFGIAFVVGPLVGGFLTENFSWHWIFYVNIPIGLVSLFFIWRLLPTVKNPRATRSFDILGGVIFSIAIAFLLVGLTNKQFSDWTDPKVGGFILIALVGIVLFILAERRAKEPIIPLHLFRLRTYSTSMISTFFASFAFFGAVVFLPRWFQFVHGFTPDRVRPGGPAVDGRPDLQLDRVRPRRLAHRPLQVAGRGGHRPDGHLVCADDPAHVDDAAAHGLVLDVHRRPRRRSDLRRLHHHHPERRALPRARRGDLEPDLLPPDRWLGLAGHRGHHLRHHVPGASWCHRSPRRAFRSRSSTASSRPAPAAPSMSTSWPARRRLGPRQDHPGPDPGCCAVLRGAVHQRHRPGHLRRLQPGRCADVLHRGRRRHRGRGRRGRDDRASTADERGARAGREPEQPAGQTATLPISNAE